MVKGFLRIWAGMISVSAVVGKLRNEAFAPGSFEFPSGFILNYLILCSIINLIIVLLVVRYRLTRISDEGANRLSLLED